MPKSVLPRAIEEARRLEVAIRREADPFLRRRAEEELAALRRRIERRVA